MKKQYQLSEFQFYDGEEFITFNLIDINTEKKEITVAVTDRGDRPRTHQRSHIRPAGRLRQALLRIRRRLQSDRLGRLRGGGRMKLTLANIKELKRNSDSPLLKRVCNYVIDRWSDYDDKKGIFTDVLHYGCQSGIVGELIYYHDTVRFYKQYRQEINSLLYDLMNGTGLYSPTELFGDKWDKEDPLAQDDYNQNLLAWFGFEETLRNIGYNFETLQNYI